MSRGKHHRLIKAQFVYTYKLFTATGLCYVMVTCITITLTVKHSLDQILVQFSNCMDFDTLHHCNTIPALGPLALNILT